jgi:hypothetical protein
VEQKDRLTTGDEIADSRSHRQHGWLRQSAPRDLRPARLPRCPDGLRYGRGRVTCSKRSAMNGTIHSEDLR